MKPFTVIPAGWTEGERRDLEAGTEPPREPASLLREIRRPILRDRVVLVGEANTRSSRPDRALAPLPAHASGGRLAQILGLSVKDYLRTFYRLNLFVQPPARWPSADARRCAEVILGEVPDDARFILLGRKVADAFRVPYEPFRRRGRFLVLPHPSGRCRAWNDPKAARRARRAFRGMIAKEIEDGREGDVPGLRR